jgi:hypothetical protein
MERKPSAQDLQRISLAFTCRWTSISLALSFLATIAILVIDNKLALTGFRTWLLYLNSFATYGVVALLAVVFSQLANYFNPEDVAISNLARIMTRLSMGAAAGYVLLVPIFVVASIAVAPESASASSLLPGCIRLLAMAVGFVGASRTRSHKGSPFLTSSVESPLDSWLNERFRR